MKVVIEVLVEIAVMKLHGFASATYTSVSQGNKLENWKDEFLWNH